MSPSARAEPDLRLAEVVAALSVATDLGTGHPIERSLRTCLLGLRFGALLGVSESDLAEIYYVALLRYAGCTASSHRADLFGDEIALGSQIDTVELWQPVSMLRFLVDHIGAGEPPLRRAVKLSYALATGIKRSEEAAVAHCEVAQGIAERMALAQGIYDALGQTFERWDGGGVPGSAKGEGLALSTRIVHLAQDAELFYRIGGVEAVQTVIRQRSGGLYDPALARRFCDYAPELLPLCDTESVWDTVIAAEPGTAPRLSPQQVNDACRVIADFADLRSPYTLGHSTRVAELAQAAAQRCGLPADEITLVYRAGFLHDVGKTAISISIWKKPGALNESEWERVRLHPYYTERIFARSPALMQIGKIAALHHEMLDGSGYHRGLPAPLLPPAARILAAANRYCALTEGRPYRPAYDTASATEQMSKDARAGRLDAQAVRAVLDVAGQRKRRPRADQVAGLSEREIEVLRLIARGMTKRQAAQALTISERTVDHHIRHIYNKIGVSTRAAATLFAMQHHLLEK